MLFIGRTHDYKKEEFPMKNTVRVLGIVIILLVLAQIAVMFLPYFDFADMVKPTKRDPNPKSVFSLQDYCWMDTEDMGKNFFSELIDDYSVNDHAVSLVLTFAIGCVVVILNAMNFANSFNTFVTFRAGMIRVVTHIFSVLWCYIAINAYLTSGVLQFGDQQLYMLSMNLILAATGIIALRLIVDLVASISSANKARAERRAARQAA